MSDNEDGVDPAAPLPDGSLLGQIGERARSLVAQDTKVLWVGAHPRLKCLYRALSDTELQTVQNAAQARSDLQRRGGKASSLDVEKRVAAVTLATACVELLAVDDDGNEIPLADVVEQETGTKLAGPLRYDRDTARILKLGEIIESEGLGDPDAPTATAVVTALHLFGRGNTAPMRSAAQIIQVWSSRLQADALDEALQGN
ncbi:MAG: hypothetical protein QM679_02890 [Patulibacter sp.]